MRITCGRPEITLSRATAGKGLAHGILGCRISDEDNGDGSGLAAVALRFSGRGAARSIRAKSPARRAGSRSRPRFPACRAPAGGCSSRPRGAASAPCAPQSACRSAGRTARMRTPRAMSPMSESTADAVAMPPAPGPTSVSGLMPVGVDGDRIGHAHHLGDGLNPCAPWSGARAARCPAASSPRRRGA